MLSDLKLDISNLTAKIVLMPIALWSTRSDFQIQEIEKSL